MLSPQDVDTFAAAERAAYRNVFLFMVELCLLIVIVGIGRQDPSRIMPSSHPAAGTERQK